MEDYQAFREIVRKLVQKLGLLQKSDAVCCGVTVAQCHALTEIGRAEGMTLTDLAEALNLDKSTTSRAVESLVTNGLADRREAPENRRTVNIMLTEKGRRMAENIEQGTNQYFRNILLSVPAKKRPLVAEALALLETAVEQQKSCCK